MDATVLVVGVLVVLAVAVVAWLLTSRRRSEQLRTEFGPEYERVVDDRGDRRAAEAELEARQRRVEALDIRPLDPIERGRYAEVWRQVQVRFVDQPAQALLDADRLVQEVMLARGYPVVDFDTRVADISVDHPTVVEHYRVAHAIAGRLQSQVDTEELRQGMIHFRALFDDLLKPDGEVDASAAASSERLERVAAPAPARLRAAREQVARRDGGTVADREAPASRR